MSKRKPNKVKTEADAIFTPVNSESPAKTPEELKTMAEENDIPMVSTVENPEPHKPAIGEIISRPSKEPVAEVKDEPAAPKTPKVESKATVTKATELKKPESKKPEQKRDYPLLFSADEYDSMKPEETFRAFIRCVKDMVTRFDANNTRLAELENEMQDVMHFMEMSKPKNVPTGYKLYKKLTDIRKERRACKNENDLLKPVYEMFHGTKLLDQLSHVQGECGKAKKTIDGRSYTVRTGILEDLVE